MLYCTKDTYVSHALQTVRDPWWVEKQTGVALDTLKRHYAKWMPQSDCRELRRLATAFEGAQLSRKKTRSRDNSSEVADAEESFECEEGDLNPHGCYPTSPSN